MRRAAFVIPSRCLPVARRYRVSSFLIWKLGAGTKSVRAKFGPVTNRIPSELETDHIVPSGASAVFFTT